MGLYGAPTVSALPGGAPGGASCSFFNGNGLTVTLPSDLGTSDFTIEFSLNETTWAGNQDSSGQIMLGQHAVYPNITFPSLFSTANPNVVQYVGSNT